MNDFKYLKKLLLHKNFICTIILTNRDNTGLELKTLPVGNTN